VHLRRCDPNPRAQISQHGRWQLDTEVQGGGNGHNPTPEPEGYPPQHKVRGGEGGTEGAVVGHTVVGRTVDHTVARVGRTVERRTVEHHGLERHTVCRGLECCTVERRTVVRRMVAQR
jgi:hypothetical protein